MKLQVNRPNRPTACLTLQEEAVRVLGDKKTVTLEEFTQLKYNMRCINESMRLYPHPPVLLRRALVEHQLPGGITVRCLICWLEGSVLLGAASLAHGTRWRAKCGIVDWPPNPIGAGEHAEVVCGCRFAARSQRARTS